MQFDDFNNLNDILYKLKNLGTACTILHTAAHPDDEDNGLLTYLACKYGVRVVCWSATRGEGGLNYVGHEQNEALSIIRSWEAEECGDTGRNERLFGPFFDFGYCKSPEKAFKNWGKENMVREIARVIRMVQPHIIISRWQGNAGDFHGHHQAVGLTTPLAYEAAGDPKQFKELEKQGLHAWQAQKLYCSMDNSGGDMNSGSVLNLFGLQNKDLDKTAALRINAGEFDPITGKTYQARAAIAFNQHKSQCEGTAATNDDFYYYYLLRDNKLIPDQDPAAIKEDSFFDGLNRHLKNLLTLRKTWPKTLRAKLLEIQKVSLAIEKQFDLKKPKPSISKLVTLLNSWKVFLHQLSKSELTGLEKKQLKHYSHHKIKTTEALLIQIAGIKLEGLANKYQVIPGESFSLEAKLHNPNAVDIGKSSFRIDTPEDWDIQQGLSKTADHRQLHHKTYNITVAKNAQLTRPYWLKYPMENDTYKWEHDFGDHFQDCQPFSTGPVILQCTLSIHGYKLKLKQQAISRESFPGGFRELNIAVVSPIILESKTQRILITTNDGGKTLPIEVNYKSNTEVKFSESAKTVAPKGMQITPTHLRLKFDKIDDVKTGLQKLKLPKRLKAGKYTLKHVMTRKGRHYSVNSTTVLKHNTALSLPTSDFNCPKIAYLVESAATEICVIDVEFIKNLTYAYIPGEESGFVEILQAFGLNFSILNPKEISDCNLKQFDAILVGTNAYSNNADVAENRNKLLNYCKQGGSLIVQYQNYPYNLMNAAPYPVDFGAPADRICDNDAKMKILLPEHRIFNFPNQITLADFDGWIKDRGTLFFHNWDPKYQVLLSAKDAADKPQLGGLLYTEYGKGQYIYLAYDLFRQIPAGVDGAVRLMANILATPKK